MLRAAGVFAMNRPDPVLQVLQRKAYRVRCAHPDDRHAAGAALLKTLIRLLDSKVGGGVQRPVSNGGKASAGKVLTNAANVAVEGGAGVMVDGGGADEGHTSASPVIRKKRECVGGKAGAVSRPAARGSRVPVDFVADEQAVALAKGYGLDVVFPLAFPTECLSIAGGLHYAVARTNNGAVAQFRNLSNTSVVLDHQAIYTATGFNVDIYFIALGH
ncbi:hypothetical protein ACFPAG_16460 [Vogesella sp. GCM10023246]|uniref:Putative tail fiber protein gp53-like C-terminal domain-containing protein n=1 Tax=Vogesella oryzagri TaxID=3160864 RepID=A0ABV1M8Z4_9NEIS